MGEEGNYRLYSVIYMLQNGEMVCTEAVGADIQYPGSIFNGLESNNEARIALKVSGETDHTMTKRFFGQWLRFEQIATQYMPTQTTLTTDDDTSDNSESETVVPSRRVADSDDLNYDTN